VPVCATSVGWRRSGLAVRTAPVCRVAEEFAEEIRRCESEEADCFITLHLAYSHSLEVIGAFCKE